MGQQIYTQWLAVENIAKFEQQLRAESDTCQRKLLEGLLVLERERLKAATAAGR
jgi:hypothetical protein